MSHTFSIPYLRICRFGSSKQCLDRKESNHDIHGWSPLVFQNIQTDSTSLEKKLNSVPYDTTNIGVPDFGHKVHLKGLKRILVRNMAMNLKEGTFIYGVLGASYKANKVP